MGYEKINVELIAYSDERDTVVAELTSAIDMIEISHTIFGGAIGTASVEHRGTRRKLVLRHTLNSKNDATGVGKLDAQRVAAGYK